MLKHKNAKKRLPNFSPKLRGPNWGFFCAEIRAFTGLGARLLQPFPKSLVSVKYYSNIKWPLTAVNGR